MILATRWTEPCATVSLSGSRSLSLDDFVVVLEAGSCELPDKINYKAHVLPLVKAKCVHCHGPELAEHRFRADLYQPHDKWADALQQIETDYMPEEGTPLSACEKLLLRSWVRSGKPE